MANNDYDGWNPGFLTSHPLFWPLLPFAEDFVRSHVNWPTLDDYQQFLESGVGRILSGNNQLLRFVSQDEKPEKFEESYEPRIFLRGEIQTRLRNWHDFFQVLVWRMFPNTKAAINKLHFHAIKARLENNPDDKQRSPMENALTQFDECGAVVLSSNPELLDLIKHFQWKALFWQHRADIAQQLKCIVFGHAVYEKALNPYVGMTAHSILLPVPARLLDFPVTDLLPLIDKQLVELFTDKQAVASPADFAPFPLLGMPGWDTDNHHESYYENTRYFRSGRQSKT